MASYTIKNSKGVILGVMTCPRLLPSMEFDLRVWEFFGRNIKYSKHLID